MEEDDGWLWNVRKPKSMNAAELADWEHASEYESRFLSSSKA
jgi:hypothetical protein